MIFVMAAHAPGATFPSVATLSELLEEDHREIDRLLEEACAGAEIDLAVYDEFRARLLRHIGWEEKILFRAAAEARGEPLTAAARLRRDHGRIAALLTRRPTPALVDDLTAILAEHNAIEEGDAGAYAECDDVLSDQADDLIARMRAVPEVPLAPFYEGPIPLPERARGPRSR